MFSSDQNQAVRRAPLLLFVLPFTGGLGAARFLEPGNLWPGVVALGILLLLLARLDFRDFRWTACFLIAVFALGFAWGLRLPATGTDHAEISRLPPVPREAVANVDPVQMFLSPPYSQQHLGLANFEGYSRPVYFRAPSTDGKVPMDSGFHWEMRGVMRSLAECDVDPGFQSYLSTRGVMLAFEGVTDPLQGPVVRPWAAVFGLLRGEARAALSAGFSQESTVNRIYQALVLGQRLGLDRAQKADFRDTGTAHLFAISGLHIGLVATFLFTFFRSIRMGSRPRVAATLAILLFYVLLTGAAPSAVRAFLMVAFLIGARAFDRGYRPESALAASALAVLAFFPGQLFTLGFQLSYTVVLSILVFGIPLSGALLRATDPPFRQPDEPDSKMRKVRVWLFTSLGISIAAFLASAPMSIDHFGVLPFSAIVLNLLLIPPATVVLALGFVSLFAGLIGADWISGILNLAAAPVIEAMVWLVSKTAALPVSSLEISFARDWMGPVTTLAFLVTAFWTGSRPVFRIRHLALPTGVLAGSVLLAATG